MSSTQLCRGAGKSQAAKVLEDLDAPLYALLGRTVSGHTLKHLAAAGGAYWILRMLKKRSPLEVPAGPVERPVSAGR